MIEFYINEIIKNHFKDSKSNTTIILKGTDESIIGKVIILENQIAFYGYQYSRDNMNSPWNINKTMTTYETFKDQYRFAHKIEVV